MLTRRDFLAAASAASVLARVGVRGAFAAPGPDAGGCLVYVFQRGGCDGLSLVAPSNDPDYVADRPGDLRVADSGDGAGVPIAHDVAPHVDFRLHPAAAPLADLYADKGLAIVHAAGLLDGTRSHFVAQDLIDRGLGTTADLRHPAEGWASRLPFLGRTRCPAVATGAAIPHSLHGLNNAISVGDLRGNGLGWPGGKAGHDALKALWSAGRGDPFTEAALRGMADLDVIDGALPRGADGKVEPYKAADGSRWGEDESSRMLQAVARVVRMDVGLKVACVDIGGWDHHENLAGRFRSLCGQFSNALYSFWNDIGDKRSSTTVVVMTEFGRRLRTNKSGGADHGHGGVMLALGAGIRGGRMFGAWPGLSAERLDNGVDLAVTTDYRDVLAEVLSATAGRGAKLAEVFPGHAAKPVGIAA
jgi:uncharacterized protein (DUF1501 family)